MGYSDVVFVRIIYWVRCTMNRCAFQSIKGLKFLSDERAGKKAIPAFLIVLM
jgi:hypothetical protein